MGRKSWRKLWQDALRSSPKWTHLSPSVKGLWFEMFLMAKESGALELHPDRPLTIKDFAYELRVRPYRVRQWVEQLAEVGLLETRDGTFYLCGMSALCAPYVRSSSAPLPLQSRSSSGSRPPQSSTDKDLRPDSAIEEKRGEEKRKNPPKPPKGPRYTNGFCRFWNAYPRKVGKGAAFRKWKARGDVAEATIIKAVERQKRSEQWMKSNGQFIPHPSTWLNQRRWEDEGVEGELIERPDIEIGTWNGHYEERA